ncbi:hypothetical protein BH11PSE9_BH11PSE9_01030 [soil metagenome]
MLAATDLVPSAEAAFIAGLTDKEMHRVVDEGVLPEALYERGEGRRFTRVAGAFAKFYFESGGQFTKTLRRDVIEQLTQRLMRRDDHDLALALGVDVSSMDWSVQLPFGSVALSGIVSAAQERAARISKAHRHITEDPQVMEGLPVFAGTRVPIETVVASRTAGVGTQRLRASYPFITPDLIEDAEIYLQIHPRRGRPRKIAGSSSAKPAWNEISRKTVRPASR